MCAIIHNMNKFKHNQILIVERYSISFFLKSGNINEPNNKMSILFDFVISDFSLSIL